MDVGAIERILSLTTIIFLNESLIRINEFCSCFIFKEEAMEVADTVIITNQGKIEQTGTPEDGGKVDIAKGPRRYYLQYK